MIVCLKISLAFLYLNNKFFSVLLVLYELLVFPNPHSALRRDVAEVYKSNKAEFNRICKEWINLYTQTLKK
jgi:ubiquitin-protein ligase